MHVACLVTFALFACSLASIDQGQRFSESLLVQPLTSPRVVAFRFLFETSSSSFSTTTTTTTDVSEFGVFPKVVAKLADSLSLSELHVSFTQGRWLTDSWGAAPPGSEAPQGAELWAWFSETNSTVSSRWAGLRHALSGLLCSSLNVLGDELTASPGADVARAVSMMTDGNAAEGRTALHGALPKEATCTENLTPWVKLLPCRDRSGIGALLNPLRLFGVPFHSMSLHFHRRAPGNEYALTQSLTVVLPRQSLTDRVSLESMFAPLKSQRAYRSHGVVGGISACPLASSSRVFVAASPDHVAPPAGRTAVGPRLVMFDLIGATAPSPLRLSVAAPAFPSAVGPAVVSAHRFLTGYGQVGGGLRTIVRSSPSSQGLVNATVFQCLPFFVRPYFSSLAVRVNGVPVDTPLSALSRISVSPGRGTAAAASLEVSATLPPGTELSFEISYESEFLHISRHPPDANRGWDLPAGVVVVSGFEDGRLTTERHYTEGLLLSLPTPDFSMPYNVITLTCTVVALFYGSVVTLTTRRWKTVFAQGQFVTERPIVRIIKFVLRTLSRIGSAISRPFIRAPDPQ